MNKKIVGSTQKIDFNKRNYEIIQNQNSFHHHLGQTSVNEISPKKLQFLESNNGKLLHKHQEDSELFEIQAYSDNEQIMQKGSQIIMDKQNSRNNNNIEPKNEQERQQVKQGLKRGRKKGQKIGSYQMKKKIKGDDEIQCVPYESNEKMHNYQILSKDMAFDQLAFFMNMEANIISHLQKTHSKVEELRNICSKFA